MVNSRKGVFVYIDLSQSSCNEHRIHRRVINSITSEEANRLIPAGD